MTTATLTLTDFLLARIADDQAAARCAVGFEWSDHGGLPGHVVTMTGSDAAVGNPRTAAHIARHDPARVLAECEAKREIVESVEVLTGGTKTYTERMEHTDSEDARYVIARDILRHLAQPYADHPDYDESWAVR